MADPVTMDKIVALCKRRGLIFPASEIYGGIANTYDYGHYGVLLKNNVIGAWWKAMIQERDDIVALDSAIIQHPRVWEASGHLAGFTDPLVDCRACKLRFRADHLQEVRDGVAEHRGRPLRARPLEAPGRPPGLRSHRGARVQPHVRDLDRAGEGRRLDRVPPARDRAGHLPRLQDHPPVRAQEAALRDRADRQVVPQRDHSGNFIFRTLEFEQMEMEFFVPPADAEKWHEHWMEQRMEWYVALGIDRDKLRLRPHDADELSHYSSATSDIEYLYPIGWSELEGIANRGDFDLTQHAEHSGAKLEYVDTASGERYVPHVIEPAAGVGRTVLALLCDAYDEDDIGGEQRTVLRLAPHMAPIKVAVLPLVNKDGQPEKARAIYEELRELWPTEYDTGGSIGKRYRRQDEIGTPFGVTVDHQTMEDDTVTLRDRDTLEQERVAVTELAAEVERRLG